MYKVVKVIGWPLVKLDLVHRFHILSIQMPTSAEPEDFDDPDEIELTVVREPSAPPYEKGTRTRLSARTFLLIIKRIETGWAVTQACKAEGLTYRRFRQLCQHRPNYQARYEKAERQRAEHRRESMETIVLHHAIKNWQAAGWWLERAHPDRYALKSVIRDDGTNAEKPIYAELTRDQLLASIARAKELEAEAPVGWQPPLPDKSSEVA